MSYVIGAIAAVVAGLACIWFIGGIAGIVAGVVVAALLYVGLGRLLAPEAKLGDVAASMVPNGEAAAAQVGAARALEGAVKALGERAASGDVRVEASQLAEDLERLAAYVERQPATYRRLSHYLSTYGEQCTSVLQNYLTVEHAVTGEDAQKAHADVIEAMNSLQGAAQGELKRAMGSKVAELKADSDAVRRLMEMDGYGTDARELRAAAGEGASGGGAGQPAEADDEAEYETPEGTDGEPGVGDAPQPAKPARKPAEPAPSLPRDEDLSPRSAMDELFERAERRRAQEAAGGAPVSVEEASASPKNAREDLSPRSAMDELFERAERRRAQEAAGGVPASGGQSSSPTAPVSGAAPSAASHITSAQVPSGAAQEGNDHV